MADWKRLCLVDDIPVLGSRRVKRAQGADVAVFRTTDNRVFALLDHCPHKGGPLSQGIVHGERVTCPLHNWTIGLSDGRAAAPDEGATPVFRVELRAQEVWLDAEELAHVGLSQVVSPCPGRCTPSAVPGGTSDPALSPGLALQAAADVEASALIAAASASSQSLA